MGRGHGRGEPALPGGRLARGRADGVVREAHRRRRDPPDDGRGPDPLDVDEATLGFEAIAEVGPGGHFFGSAHTLERYETAFYRPLLSDWRNFETWHEDGARTATERANTIWKQLLAESAEPPMDPAVREALDAFVARRKREIAAGD